MRELFREIRLDSPSPGFTGKVMDLLEAETSGVVVSGREPLLGKRFWMLVLLFLIPLALLPAFGNTKESFLMMLADRYLSGWSLSPPRLALYRLAPPLPPGSRRSMVSDRCTCRLLAPDHGLGHDGHHRPAAGRKGLLKEKEIRNTLKALSEREHQKHSSWDRYWVTYSLTPSSSPVKGRE